MRTRPLGRSRSMVPVLGFGAWPIGGGLGRQGIGVIIHSPLAKGLLTGSYAAASRFPADDEHSGFPDFHGERFAGHLARAERLAAIARARGDSLARLAIAWTLARPEVCCTLVGAKSPSQVREHAAAAGIMLSERELGELEKALT